MHFERIPLQQLACIVLTILPVVQSTEYSLQTFRGMVGGGNYTYYKLTLEGNVILILSSVRGDADIYVSKARLQPTFDPDEHDMQATTCGVDHVVIPHEFARPVGIGIYGHPSHDFSSYLLEVVIDSDMTHHEYGGDEVPDIKLHDRVVPPVGKDEEESVLWAIFVGILKVLLEVLAS